MIICHVFRRGVVFCREKRVANLWSRSQLLTMVGIRPRYPTGISGTYAYVGVSLPIHSVQCSRVSSLHHCMITDCGHKVTDLASACHCTGCVISLHHAQTCIASSFKYFIPFVHATIRTQRIQPLKADTARLSVGHYNFLDRG